MRYFYHLECDKDVLIDERGDEYAREDDAIDQALALARSLAADRRWKGWSVRVVGEHNVDVFSVPIDHIPFRSRN